MQKHILIFICLSLLPRQSDPAFSPYFDNQDNLLSVAVKKIIKPVQTDTSRNK